VSNARFDDDTIADVGHDLVIGVRAGSGAHRFTPVWAVPVGRRVFIRSYGLANRSWYRTFLHEPFGVVEIGGREYAVRAVRTRSERLLAAVDEAYRSKYHTAASAPYVRDMTSGPSRLATIELVPLTAG